MKILFNTVLIILLSSSNLLSQIVDIPDSNFKDALVNDDVAILFSDPGPLQDIDTNDDGEIQVSEALNVSRLDVSQKNISSLEGIQSFELLLGLNCGFNQLTSLDVSQNNDLDFLDCSSNQLPNIDVSQNTNLGILWISNNELTELDTSQNPSLIWVSCMFNSLTNLDLSQNASLESIACRDNQLTSLDIRNGNNHNTGRMWAENNPDLQCISVDDIVFANAQVCAPDGWCKDTWTDYSNDCSLGVEDFFSKSIALSPNPTRNIIIVSTKLPIENIEIYSIQGILVAKPSSHTIDVSNLNAGLYLLKGTVNGKTIVKKFMKS